MVAVSFDHQYLAFYDNNIRIYQIATSVVKLKILPETEVKSMCFSADGLRLYYTDGKILHKIQLFEDFKIKQLCQINEKPRFLCANGPNVFISCSTGVYHYDEESQLLKNISEKQLLAVCSNENLSKKTTFKTFHSSSSIKNSDGYKLFVAGSKLLQNITPEEEEANIQISNDILFIKSNGNCILSYDSAEIRIYDCLDLKVLYCINETQVISAELSFDSNHILLVFNDSIVVYDLATMSKKSFFANDTKNIAAYNNSLQFVSISSTSNVKIFDFQGNDYDSSFNLNLDFTGQLQVYSNDKYLFSSTIDGIVLSSLQDYTYLAIIPISNLTSFCLSTKEKKIYYSKNNSLYSMINPVNSYFPVLLEFEDFSFNT